MKTWLSRFNSSAALDPARPSRNSPAAPGVKPADECEFDQSLLSIHAALQGSPPRPEAPAGLHSAVMNSLRRSPAARPMPVYLRWAVATACALFLAFGVAALANRLRPRFQPSPFTAKAALRVNQELAQFPSTALAPLSQEWKNLGTDWQRTTEFLLSSVP